jgi:hypothetical protein
MKIGPYTFTWKNPIHYLILWTFTTLILLVIAGIAPGLATMFAFGVCVGTFLGVARLKRG